MYVCTVCITAASILKLPNNYVNSISEYKNLLYIMARHYCKMSLGMCTIECIFMVMEESG